MIAPYRYGSPKIFSLGSKKPSQSMFLFKMLATSLGASRVKKFRVLAMDVYP